MALAICLLMFDSLPNEGQARLHPQVREAFSAETVFRFEALAALAAGSFEDSGAIATFRAKAPFARSIKISAEKLHAGPGLQLGRSEDGSNSSTGHHG